MLVTRGVDIDRPWRELPQSIRDWILFTEERPTIPVYVGLSAEAAQRAQQAGLTPSYQGTFIGARWHVLQTFATSESSRMRAKARRFLVCGTCAACEGKRLKKRALDVRVGGLDIVQALRLPLIRLAEHLRAWLEGDALLIGHDHPERAVAGKQISEECLRRLEGLIDLGLGHLSLERSAPSLSFGELQRIKVANQIHADLFGVAYVLDEPSAGLHPSDAQALYEAISALRARGNSVLLVEHSLDLIRRADWVVEVGPGAGRQGGHIVYSGPVDGLQAVAASRTAHHLALGSPALERGGRRPTGWLRLSDVTHNNLCKLDVSFPLGSLTVVTGVSGSGKSSLVAQVLPTLSGAPEGASPPEENAEDEPIFATFATSPKIGGVDGHEAISRFILVDQKPIGRTPRSNLATYTGLFDDIRELFAESADARDRGFASSRFSFNVRGGRCEKCKGDGQISVELLFMPDVFAPCPDCHGLRYNNDTLQVKMRGKTIADVLNLTIDEASSFFSDVPRLKRCLAILTTIGLGYLCLGQPAPQLSGGEAQRIKLAAELMRARQSNVVYLLDEPTTGLHAEDVGHLLKHVGSLVGDGATVIVAENDMRVAASADWIIDLGPGAGAFGGTIVAEGPPARVAKATNSITAPFLERALNRIGQAVL